ncbi:hypothetical protein MZO42_02185 [Sphingomonas psychrotolerans]|uniref:Lipoprotein n=1 Tax=Sphingomonas psychrotolerans TaxID=1327635 RepID=A0ABU3MYV7_9SPHN|nr:hypothetical protein [Sphingomonas psychrotolerans]MDT8757495.1 hypothetical protein [Sphingomonas psychrotolerans]
MKEKVRVSIWTLKGFGLFSLAACAMQEGDTRHEALMDSIEQKVVLPKGAEPLNAYGRSYAFEGKDRVLGSYSIPVVSKSGPCTVVMPGNTSRPCSAEEIAADEGAQLHAGARRWYDSAGDMPRRLWAGCEQVNVVYEIATRRMLEALCDKDG